MKSDKQLGGGLANQMRALGYQVLPPCEMSESTCWRMIAPGEANTEYLAKDAAEGWKRASKHWHARNLDAMKFTRPATDAAPDGLVEHYQDLLGIDRDFNQYTFSIKREGLRALLNRITTDAAEKRAMQKTIDRLHREAEAQRTKYVDTLAALAERDATIARLVELLREQQTWHAAGILETVVDPLRQECHEAYVFQIETALRSAEQVRGKAAQVELTEAQSEALHKALIASWDSFEAPIIMPLEDRT